MCDEFALARVLVTLERLFQLPEPALVDLVRRRLEEPPRRGGRRHSVYWLQLLDVRTGRIAPRRSLQTQPYSYNLESHLSRADGAETKQLVEDFIMAILGLDQRVRMGLTGRCITFGLVRNFARLQVLKRGGVRLDLRIDRVERLIDPRLWVEWSPHSNKWGHLRASSREDFGYAMSLVGQVYRSIVATAEQQL